MGRASRSPDRVEGSRPLASGSSVSRIRLPSIELFGLQKRGANDSDSEKSVESFGTTRSRRVSNQGIVVVYSLRFPIQAARLPSASFRMNDGNGAGMVAMRRRTTVYLLSTLKSHSQIKSRVANENKNATIRVVESGFPDSQNSPLL